MRLPAASVTLRGATPEDLAFLARLYHDSRRQEVSAWGWPPEQQEQFLQMQFEAQSRFYRDSFPEAADSIVCLEDTPVGRILVTQETAEVRLIDIALLDAHRNNGIGTMLLQNLQAKCQSRGHSLRLQVFQANPAIRLYRRLGFQQSEGGSVYLSMQWNPL